MTPRESKVTRLRLLLSGDVELNPGPDIQGRLGDKPTLQELSCFTYTSSNGEEKNTYIIDEVAARWKRLGIALNFEQYQLDNIKRNYHTVEERCQELLGQWLERGSVALKPAGTSWEKLLKAMKEAQCSAVAQELQVALSGEDPSVPSITNRRRRQSFVIPISCVIAIFALFLNYSWYSSVHLQLEPYNYCPPLPASLEQYKNHLHDVYRRYAYSIHMKPSETIAPNRPEQPLNLVLVHRPKNELESSHKEQMECAFHGNVDLVEKQSTLTKLEEIGSMLKGRRIPAHFVLIEGAPGVGKSTLCWQLCQLWSEGKLRHKWDLMVLVEIRDETTRKARNVYDLLYHPDDSIRKSTAQEVEKREGEGLLIIFDGYDELSDDQRSELSIFYRILVDRLLLKATVVVTTRKIDTKSLPSHFKQNIDQHLEIFGFNKSDIQRYISLACGNNTHLFNDFLSYVSNRPFIFSLMYNPLHCTIVTELYIRYWQDGQKGFAPNTLTELYNAYLLNLLRRNLPGLLDIEELSDLSTHLYNNLMQLAELAESQKKFVYSKVPGNTLGLMVSVRQLYDIRARRSAYMFLQLTLQEYLAAIYWFQQPREKLRAFMENQAQIGKPIMVYRECATEGTDHWPVALFLAGLTKLDPVSYPIDEMTGCMSEDPGFICAYCQMLFEAQLEKEYDVFANRAIVIEEPLICQILCLQ